MMRNKDFVAFILTHGRPDNVVTYTTLQKSGYTGRVVFVLDDEDNKRERYEDNFGKENIVVFSKSDIAETFDEGLKGDRRTIVYARNACFELAKKLGYRYFIELDDDYIKFDYRFNHKFEYLTGARSIKNLDAVLDLMIDYYKSIPAKSIAMAQGGDFVNGANSSVIRTKRKAMNSFICDTERQFSFLGRINEDVNTYTRNSSVGDLFLQINMLCLEQKPTQTNTGGMTDVYRDSGTFIKSFFSVMYQPSSVKIALMGNKLGGVEQRIHHFVKWNNTAPKILPQKYKKQ